MIRVIEITGEPLLHGGQERFITNLLENIDYTDLNIDVLTPYISDNAYFTELVESEGGRVSELNLDFNPGASRRLLLEPITDFLRDKRYDAAHIHSGSVSALAYMALAAKRAGIKKIIVHSHSTGVPSLKHTFIRFVFGFILKACATDFLACSAEAGRMKYPQSVTKNRLKVIKNGINIEDYKRNDAIRKVVRNSLGIGEGCFVIGHVGRFSKEKNHSFIIDLFADVREKIPDSALLLLGDGELFDEIKEKTERLALSDRVFFTGNVDNVQDYYQIMDLFILPSLYEGFSFVTLEAQASGLPCLVSTGVPTDVIIGNNTERIDLDNYSEWLNKTIAYRGVGFEDNYEKIISSGFDIKVTADIIRALYLNDG